MTYSTGGLIQADDYNGFVSTTVGANVNATLSAYGQTTLATVAAGTNTVTATQWSTLNASIASLATHQGTTVTSRSGPTGGDVISVQANVNTDLTNIYTNRFNAASVGTQYSTLSGNPSATTVATSGQAAWTITFTSIIAFGNNTAATSFFNAGGLVKIQFSKTSTGTTADTEWNAFVGPSGVGTVRMPAAVYLSSTQDAKTIVGSSYNGVTVTLGSGASTDAGTVTNNGFAQLTPTSTEIYKVFDTGTAYSSNYVSVSAANNGSGTLTITTVWYDSGAPDAGAVSQITGGTATTGPSSWGDAPTTLVTYIPPETTNISNVWGTPTITNSYTAV